MSAKEVIGDKPRAFRAIKRVPRHALSGDAEALGMVDQVSNAAVPLKQLPAVAPGCYQQLRLGARPPQPTVSARPDRVGYLGEDGRVGGTEAKEIHQEEGSISPLTREPHTPSQCRIIGLCIGGRRVQANERALGQGAVPFSSQPVTITTAARKPRATLHRRNTILIHGQRNRR